MPTRGMLLRCTLALEIALLFTLFLSTSDGAVVRSFYYNATSYISSSAKVTTGGSQSFFSPTTKDASLVFSVQFDQPVYVRPHECQSGNCCAGPTVARCCANCDSVTLLPSPGSPAGCVCPSMAGVTCIDDLSRFNGTLGRDEAQLFEIGIIGACQNLVVKVEVATGEINMAMEPGEGKWPDLNNFGNAYAYTATQRGSDSLTMCCDALDGLPFVHPLVQQYSNSAPYDNNPLTHAPRRTLANVIPGNVSSHQGIARLRVQTVGYIAGSNYLLSLELGSAQNIYPQMSLRDHWWWPTKSELSCTSPIGAEFTCVPFAQSWTNPLYPCLLQPLPSMDTVDSYSQFYRTLGTIGAPITVNPSLLLPNQYDFQVVFSSQSVGQYPSFLPDGSAVNCTLTMRDLYTAAGQPLQSTPIGPIQYLPPGPCDAAALDQQFVEYDTLISEITSAVTGIVNNDMLSDREYLFTGIVNSAAVRDCFAHFSDFVLDTEPTYVANTTYCPYEPDTPEFIYDPCCNVQLQQVSCCMPRVIEIAQVPIPNAQLIADNCHNPACAERLISDQLTLFGSRRDMTSSCDWQVLSVARAIPAIPNPLSYTGVVNGACSKYVFLAVSDYIRDGGVGSVPFDPYGQAVLDCVINELLNAPDLANEFASTYFGFNRNQYPDPRAFDNKFTSEFLLKYTATNHCIESGMPFNADGTVQRIASLDSSQSACEAYQTCNWDPLRSQADCINPSSFRGSGFCARCDGNGYCMDYSDQNACVMHRNFYSAGMPAVCASLGGVLLQHEVRGEDRSRTSDWCYLPNITDEQSCLNPNNASEAIFACPTNWTTWGVNYNAVYGWNYDSLGLPTSDFNFFCSVGAPCNHNCFDYCIINGLDASNCTCNALPPDSPWVTSQDCLQFYALGDGSCAARKIARDFDCTARGGTYIGGRVWHVANLNSEAECTAAGGICTTAPGFPYDFCSTVASCSHCDPFADPNCNQSYCESKMACTDTFDFPTGPACVFPAPFDYASLTASCLSLSAFFPTLTKAGCVSTRFSDFLGVFGGGILPQDPDTCAFWGGQWHIPAGYNSTACTEGLFACYETNGVLGGKINTYKSQSECKRCGGTPVPLYEMAPGVWTLVGGWQNLTWVNRTFGPNFRWGPGFFHNNFSTDFNNLIANIEAKVAAADLQCNFGNQMELLRSLSCSCLDATSSGSRCFDPRGNLLGEAYICSGTNLTHGFGATTVAISSAIDFGFAGSCGDLTIYGIPLSSYSLRTPALYSSLFLQSTAPNPYAVVLNSEGISVAQLVGDGATIRLAPAPLNTSQAITLCFDLDAFSSIPRDSSMQVPDFATMDSSLSISSLRIANLNVYQDPNYGNCAIIPGNGNYIPIYRVANPEDRSFRNTLTKQQQVSIWVALGLYAAMALTVYYRLGSAIMYSFRKKLALLLIGIWGLAGLILTIRWVYFTLVMTGQLYRTPRVADLTLAEVPTTLFVTLFSLIVLFWVFLYHASVSFKMNFTRFKIVLGTTFAAIMVLLYIFLIVVIAIYSAEKNSSSIESCGTSGPSKTATILSKVYKIVLSSIVLILAIAFIIYGFVLSLVLIKSSHGHWFLDTKILRTALIALIFPVALMLQCALLLYATFGSRISTPLALAFLIAVELVPILVLHFALQLPWFFEQWYKEVIWCCFPQSAFSWAAESSASTSAGSKNSSSGQMMEYSSPDDL